MMGAALAGAAWRPDNPTLLVLVGVVTGLVLAAGVAFVAAPTARRVVGRAYLSALVFDF